MLVALLIAPFLTNPGAATPSQSFTYTFAEGASGWGFYTEADADKWQVVQVAPGNFAYQGTAPSDQNHYVSSAPPSDDVIKDWQSYAVETKVRVVHPGINDMLSTW